MVKFEKVTRFKNDPDLNMPYRKTAESAGYDFEVAETVVIPSYFSLIDKLKANSSIEKNVPLSLEAMANITKTFNVKPTLVTTGMKCYLEDNTHLELFVRSSCPLKYWLIMANSTGIIDADYVDNPDNEGEIFFQIINFSPFDIILQKGDIIGQGIIKEHFLTDDDCATGCRNGGFGSTSK